MDTERGESLLAKVTKVILRILAVLWMGFVSAVLGFIAGVIIVGNFAGIYELTFGHEFVINGRVGYEAAWPMCFILGGLIGLVGSSVFLFRKRTAN